MDAARDDSLKQKELQVTVIFNLGYECVNLTLRISIRLLDVLF
jgi:hypothetical protein